MTLALGWVMLLTVLSTFFPEWFSNLATSLAAHPEEPVLRTFDGTTRVLNDTSGRISEIVINVPREQIEQIVPVVDGLLNHLHPQIRLTFACSDEAIVQAIQYRIAQPRTRFPWKTDIVLTNFRLSSWARDRRIARSGPLGQERFSLVPPAKDWYGDDRRNEIRLPYLLNELNLAPEATPLPFLLDGGNLVTDSNFAFIGGNNIAVNRNIIPNAQDLKRMLKLYLGTPVIHVFGRKKQVPWDHIDMYVTPLPNQRVLIASPELADHVLRNANETHPITKEKFLRLSFSKERSILFDDVAAQFKKLKYEVIRIPAIPHYLDHWMITYNNVLMDFRDQQPVVYLPHYQLPSLDAYAADIFRKQGFQVLPVDVTSLYRNGGSLRCFANVTQRLPELPKRDLSSSSMPPKINIHRPGRWELQEILPPTP